MNRTAMPLLLLLVALVTAAMPGYLKRGQQADQRFLGPASERFLGPASERLLAILRPSERIQAVERDAGMGSGEDGGAEEEYSLDKTIDLLIRYQTADILFNYNSTTVNKTVEATPKISNIVNALKPDKEKLIQEIQKEMPTLAQITQSVYDGMTFYARIMIEMLAERKINAKIVKFIQTELGPKMIGVNPINVDELLTNDVKNKFLTTMNTYIKKQIVDATKKEQTAYIAAWNYLSTEVESYLRYQFKYDIVAFIKSNYKGVKVVYAKGSEKI